MKTLYHCLPLMIGHLFNDSDKHWEVFINLVKIINLTFVFAYTDQTIVDLRETIKIKTTNGESKQTLLGDGADGEEYVKHLMSFTRFMEEKGYEADLEAASKVTLSATTAPKKLAKAQAGEKDPAKSQKTH
jgi:hypothetical protein